MDASGATTMKVISASVPDKIAEIIDALAEEKGTSRSDVTKDLIEDGLETRSFMSEIDGAVKAKVNGKSDD